jgi:hypothetical protein
MGLATPTGNTLMTLSRQLGYVTTLARERHFAWAAAACNLT